MDSVGTWLALPTSQQSTLPCVCLLLRPGSKGKVPCAQMETAERQDGEGWGTRQGGKEREEKWTAPSVWFPSEARPANGRSASDFLLPQVQP